MGLASSPSSKESIQATVALLALGRMRGRFRLTWKGSDFSLGSAILSASAGGRMGIARRRRRRRFWAIKILSSAPHGGVAGGRGSRRESLLTNRKAILEEVKWVQLGALSRMLTLRHCHGYPVFGEKSL